MIRSLIFIIGISFSVTAFSIQEQALSKESWLRKEFRLFRVYPRLDRADRFYKQENFTKARELLEQAVKIDPAYIEAHLQLIETCIKLYDSLCVDKHARQLLKLPKGSASGAYYLMMEAIQINNYSAAIVWGEQALSYVNSQLKEEEKTTIFEGLQEAYANLKNTDTKNLHDAYQIEVQDQVVISGQEEISNTKDQEQLSFKLESLLEKTDSTDTVTVEDQVILLNLLEQQGEYADALVIAQQLPISLVAINFQINLLEKLLRFEEAANLLAKNGNQREMRKPEFWHRLFNLYGKAGIREQQINTLNNAQNFIPADPLFLEMASIMLLDEASRQTILADNNESKQDFEKQTDTIMRLLAVINKNKSVEVNDDYHAYRVDAEISLASLYLNHGEDRLAWMVIEDILLESAINFDQASSLAQIIWGLGRCHILIDNKTAIGKTTNYGAQLLRTSCYRRLGELDMANRMISVLLNNKSIPDRDRYELMRTQGYLYLDQQQPKKALQVWQILLAENFDPVLALSSAYAATLTKNWVVVTDLLNRIEAEKIPDSYRSYYWQLRGGVAKENQEYGEAVHYYSEALVWGAGNTDLWLQLIDSAELAGDIETAMRGWQRLLELTEDKGNKYADYAYFLRRNGQLEEAEREFLNAIHYLPENLNLQRDLAYTQLSLGSYEAATSTLKQVIDNSHNTIHDAGQLYQDQEFLSNVGRHWTMEFNEIMRLDSGLNQTINPILRNSSYRGYGSLLVNYLPEFGRDKVNSQRLIFNSRLFWSNPDQSLSADTDGIVLAMGARYKLLQGHAVFASIERLFGLGDQAEDDTLLRLSASFSSGLGWPFNEQRWSHKNLYLDAAYFVESGVKYATVEYENGRVIRLGDGSANWGLMPYFRIGATLNNDNVGKQSETRLDAGAGISLLGRYYYDSYTGYKFGTRTSLVFSHKMAGNTDDDFAAHLRFNVSY